MVFPSTLLHASSGLVGEAAPATPRLSLVMRVTTRDAVVAPQAYAPTLPRHSWPVVMRGAPPDGGAVAGGDGVAYGPLAH